ncbi:MAG: hypothetical protein WBP63_07130 [Silvibacterium sp.]
MWQWAAAPWVAGVAFILAILGLPAIVGYYEPNITVDEAPILDQARPFSAPFQLKNSGNIIIRDVKPCFMPDDIEIGFGKPNDHSHLYGRGYSVCFPALYFDELAPGETQTTSFADMILNRPPSYLVRADFRIQVSYRYFYLIRRTEYFGFTTDRGQDGLLRIFKTRANAFAATKRTAN